MGRHHPLGISGHVGRFDVVPTPRRREKEARTVPSRGRMRTRERGRVTRLRQVHDGGGSFVKLVRGATQSGRKRGYHFLREEPSAGPTGGNR